MKKLILFIFLVPFSTFATPQIPDILVYNGKEYEWNTYNPGRDYLKRNNFKVPEDAVETTANTGYYILTFTIENDSLFLTDITILIKKERGLGSRSVFKDFFKDKTKILMDYSRVKTFSYGDEKEVTTSVQTETLFSNYLVFEFRNGIVVKSYDLEYNEYLKLRKSVFLKFKKTKDYSKFKKSEAENLKSTNEFRTKKISMKNYLELKIFSLIKTLGI